MQMGLELAIAGLKSRCRPALARGTMR